MKILEKYVLKNYIAAFLFSAAILMVLGIIGDVLGFLEDIFKNNIPLLSILSFYWNLAPFAFVNMVPFAALLSAVFVFNNLSKNHEVTAVVASGLDLWELLRPIIIVTFMLCLVTFIVSDKFVPTTMERADRIRNVELEQKGVTKWDNDRNITVYGKGGQIIFAKSYNRHTKVLNDVIIHRQNDKREVIQKISARSVKWQGNGEWQGADIMIFNRGEDGRFSNEPEVYKRRKINMNETPEDFGRNQCDPKFMSYKQLRRYIMFSSMGSPETLRRLKVDLNYKLSFPFAALVTVLAGVPFSIGSGRSSPLLGMAKGVLIALLYLPVTALCLALGKGGAVPPFVAAWAGNVAFALVGVWFINKKS